MSKRLLLIMGHGSRRTEANQEFQQLVANINAEQLPYDAIRFCFLELTEPRLNTAIDQAIADHYSDIDLYPMFFNHGNHVGRDIPEDIAEVCQQHPHLNLRQLDYFGLFQGLADTINQHVLQQQA